MADNEIPPVGPNEPIIPPLTPSAAVGVGHPAGIPPNPPTGGASGSYPTADDRTKILDLIPDQIGSEPTDSSTNTSLIDSGL